MLTSGYNISAQSDNQKNEKKSSNNRKDKDPKNDPSQIGNRDVTGGVNFYSLEKEIAMGKALAQDVEKQVKIVDDPIIAEYINRLGQNIVRNSDAIVPFTIKAIDSSDINAFALPGGFFFINTGLIIETKSEAELAGVMAHEIAHVAARHGTRQATRGELINLATIPLIFMGGGWAGYGAQQAVGLLIPMKFLQFSRQFEDEADNLGLQYLYKSGYDPVELLNFFERLQAMEKKKKGTLAKVFSTHPANADRIKKTQKAISELDSRPDYAINTSEFNKVKSLLLQKQSLIKTEDRPTGPTLRRRPGQEDASDDPESKDDDERPTLKRR